MQDQIRLLKKDLKNAREQIANPTAALTANPAPTVAAAQPPPPAPARLPPPSPARHSYQEYPKENPHYRPLRRQSDRRSSCCFLCGEEGTSLPTVQPAQSSSASYASRRTPALAARLKGESWSRRQPRTAPKYPLTYRFGC